MGDNILPEEIKTEIPSKLAEFIDKLTEEGYFNSRDDFARCSMEIIAQLYGLAKTSNKGKSLLDVLQDNGSSKPITPKTQAKPDGKAAIPAPKQTDELTAEEFDVIDLFAGVTFEFEDTLHAKYTMELMKMAKPPVTKAQFVTLLEGLVYKNKLEKGTHNKKTIWKIIDRY
jgi:Arc/MetJ-type ribon-helix-helix transcriptional regulator